MRAQAKKEERSKSSCFFNKNFKLRSIKTLLFLLFPHFPKCWSNEEEEQEDELIRDARCGAQKIDTAYSWTKSITSHIASHSPAGSLSLFSVRLGKAMEAEQKKNQKKKIHDRRSNGTVFGSRLSRSINANLKTNKQTSCLPNSGIREI
ncbi:hypothetical protein T4D_3883 [Trichinella pseudospiralis]|uniref:Uncharacterized protein n=1 Tax=Trichinella pseudospiralis TaxID=6337 RepID=A0A0V1FN50_TRIPS|nr:hypothetical protein T4D_3883 [Trichinella pseudospiralis]